MPQSRHWAAIYFHTHESRPSGHPTFRWHINNSKDVLHELSIERSACSADGLHDGHHNVVVFARTEYNDQRLVFRHDLANSSPASYKSFSQSPLSSPYPASAD